MILVCASCAHESEADIDRTAQVLTQESDHRAEKTCYPATNAHWTHTSLLLLKPVGHKPLSYIVKKHVLLLEHFSCTSSLMSSGIWADEVILTKQAITISIKPSASVNTNLYNLFTFSYKHSVINNWHNLPCNIMDTY